MGFFGTQITMPMFGKICTTITALLAIGCLIAALVLFWAPLDNTVPGTVCAATGTALGVASWTNNWIHYLRDKNPFNKEDDENKHNKYEEESSIYYVSVWWFVTLMLGVLAVWLKLAGYNFAGGPNWASIFSGICMVVFGGSVIVHTIACAVGGSTISGFYYDEQALKEDIDVNTD